MLSLSSDKKELALDILYDIQSAIERLQERTREVHHIDDMDRNLSLEEFREILIEDTKKAYATKNAI